MSDPVLDTIDNVLRDYNTSPDAMRWTPEPVDPELADAAIRRQQLLDTYGRPKMVKATQALWKLGLSLAVHPVDVAAFRYANEAAATAYEVANLAYYGHPTLGRYTDRLGVVSVLDLRGALVDLGHEPRQPSPGPRSLAEYRRRQKRRGRG